jgi:hypothetical protein
MARTERAIQGYSGLREQKNKKRKHAILRGAKRVKRGEKQL